MITATYQNVSEDCSSVIAVDEQDSHDAALKAANRCLESKTASQRVEWGLATLPGRAILSSSFGAHAAVSLHLLTQADANIPVVLIDTGYLFDQTYQFVDQLTQRLKLNLKVYRPPVSPAWQEARKGKRWEQGLEGLNDYNQENKVEPMRRALQDLQVGTWFAGLRRAQSSSRSERKVVEHQAAVWKVHPIVDWSDRDVYFYLKKHRLPLHPLWQEGYISIGDKHTTQSVYEVQSVDQTRFFGLKRECGIHEIGTDAFQST